jgi:superfamily I DNA and RNA helicase
VHNVVQLSSVDYPICNRETLQAFLNSLQWEEPSCYSAVVAVIQAISSIRKGKKKRETQNPQSRGSKLKALEDSIANLDNIQSEAVIETFEGVQRIRGLAGSGKTIILALKAAYLHARHPDWKIAITFQTRSLKGQFERLINTFVIEQTNEEPDWGNIKVIHAWGAPGDKTKEGIYYNFCRDHGVEYFDFKTAKSQFEMSREFEGACEKALQDAKQFKPIYDAVLVDEAQDFSPNFLLLCYEYLKEPKRLVYAYDELQSLNTKTLPSPEEIFGKNPDRTTRVRFEAPQMGKPKQDIILEKCYRNSRPVLTTAHALGFGIYRDQGLVQIFENKGLWLDIGYGIKEGQLEDGQRVCLERTFETSPEFLENHSSIDDLIQFKQFQNDEEQTNWLVTSIMANLKNDELQPDDIIVINPNPVTTRSAVAVARTRLLENGINSNLAGVTTSPDVFFESDSVTFTGIFRAKGNEGAMVYIINAQDCCVAKWHRDAARVRNRLFTAITRSKAWVRVCGVGENMQRLETEFSRIHANHFRLDFVYPTAAQREQINIINRDMSEEELRQAQRRRINLTDIVESLESEETFIEDYPEETIKKLEKLLQKGKKVKK